jgi:hypothetical protein
MTIFFWVKNSTACLPMHIAEKRILPTAEGEEGNWRRHTDIDQLDGLTHSPLMEFKISIQSPKPLKSFKSLTY